MHKSNPSSFWRRQLSKRSEKQINPNDPRMFLESERASGNVKAHAQISKNSRRFLGGSLCLLFIAAAYMASWKVRLTTSICCSRLRRLKFTA